MRRRAGSVLIISLLIILGCEEDNGTDPVALDTVPPEWIRDLGVKNVEEGVVTLTWTAPGDDGSKGQATLYDIRYSLNPLGGAGWDGALRVEGAPTPKEAGEVERVSIQVPTPGVWRFALKVGDEVPNWSELSNAITQNVEDWTPDVVAPNAVMDLSTVVNGTSVTFNWSAPGDDGLEGQADVYDLRHASVMITDENWKEAASVVGLPLPSEPETIESFTLHGLQPKAIYFFGLKAADESKNWSRLSNVVQVATERLMRLTYSSALYGCSRPAWSPTGGTIAFDADWGQSPGVTHLYLIPEDGGAPQLLYSGTDGVSYASWSPDGKRIAFNLHREISADLVVMDAVPGSEPTVLSNHGQEATANPEWSPDGKMIAYLVVTSRLPVTKAIYLVDAEGGGPRLLLDLEANLLGLAWSPDGSELAFGSNHGGDYDIWAVPVDGGEMRRLTTDPSWDSDPAWYQDGRIAFQSDRAGNLDIWRMSSAGDDVTQLTTGSEHEGDPSWSPDGERICFVALGSNNISDIWILTPGR